MNQLIIVNGKAFRTFISHDSILARVREMCAELRKRYQGKNPLFIGLLNGSFMFAADVMKYIEMDAEINFVRLASYRGMESSGEVQLNMGFETSIADRDIVILEDIIDSGRTLDYFLKLVQQERPRSVAIATLLLKPAAVQTSVSADIVGFEIPNKFVVGYGMDYDGLGRNLRDIWQLAD